jgi:hypothetical protein
MNEISLTAAIIAVVKAIKDQVPQVNGLITLAVAVILGGVAGYLHLGASDIPTGVMMGIAAVGTMTVASKVGGE